MARSIRIILAFAAALVAGSAVAAPVVGDNLDSYTGFGAGTAPNATIPSGVSGINWQYYGTVNAVAGFPAVTGFDGNAVSILPAETDGLVANDVAYSLSGTQRTFQLAMKVMIDNSGTGGTDQNCWVFGPFLGDAPGSCIAIGTGLVVSPSATPGVKVARVSSATADTGTYTNIGGLTTGTWVNVVIQYEAPTTLSGTDGGFHCWIDPVAATDAPLFSRGSGVTGGTGVTALGLTAARPTNGIMTPQYVGFGQTLFAHTASTAAAGSVDRIALWDGPADFTGGDQTLLGEAIAWLAGGASVSEWNAY